MLELAINQILHVYDSCTCKLLTKILMLLAQINVVATFRMLVNKLVDAVATFRMLVNNFAK